MLHMDGDCLLEQDERRALLQAGDLVIYDTTRPYSIHVGRSYRSLVLVIPRERLQRISPDQIAKVTAQSMSGEHGVGSLVAGILGNLAVNSDQFGESSRSRLADHLVGFVYTLLAERIDVVVGPESARRVLLFRIMRFIDNELGDSDLDADRIAAAHYVSVSYVRKILKKEEGLSVGDLIRRRRLERCARDLRDPRQADSSIGTISGRWGFTDSSHFSKVFRKAYGACPREYRSQSYAESANGVGDRSLDGPPADGALEPLRVPERDVRRRV
jgi:AraC-like DNA-binding protein